MKRIIKVLISLAIFSTALLNQSVVVKADDYFVTMSNRWRENVVGNFENKNELINNQYIKEYVDNLSEDAEILYESMNKLDNDQSLWDRREGQTKSSFLTMQFKNLEVITQSYGTVGSIYYKNLDVKKTIMNSLEYLVEIEKYNGDAYYGNWWDWQIGIPVPFLNILFVLQDEMPTELLEKYVNVIHKYVPDPYKQIYSNVGGEKFIPIKYTSAKTDGANRTDLAHTVLGIGILKKDIHIIEESLESIEEVFEYVQQGNGFYEDGMFIYHKDNPYIGSYGVSLFKAVSSILNIVKDTPYDMRKSMKEHFIKLVHDSTLPFINKGKFVGMVEGRAISRASNHTENALGSPIVKTLAIAAQISDDSYSNNLFKAVKYWISQDEEYYVSITNNYEELKAVINIIESDRDLTGYVPFNGSKVFASGDRFVYSDENTYIGLSMHSNRVSAYTVGNGENLKGWHLSDGFIYMMNDDKQFGKSYWPTVDMYRLPGTTVDTRPLSPARANWASHLSSSPWAGGTYSSKNASVSMQLDKLGAKNNNQNIGMDLKAKKSWFMIDGNLISLGSDINGTSPNTIETIVENKLLDPVMEYTFIDPKGNLVTTDQFANVGDTFLLKSNDDKNNIGYTFLQGTDLEVVKEVRTGSYRDINDGGDRDKFTEEYLKILINHGSLVKDDTYAYVHTPAATLDKLKKNKNRFTVIENSKKIQAVKDEETNTIAATIWDANGGEVENIKVNKNSSILYEDRALDSELFISDPTQTLESLTITFNEAVNNQEIILSENVTKISETEFKINFNKNGYTESIRFIKPVDKIELEDIDSEIATLDRVALTPYSRLNVLKVQNEVKSTIENTTASALEVKNTKEKAMRILSNLDYLMDETLVNRLILEYNFLNKDYYTDKSLGKYESKIDELKSMKNNYNIFEKLNVSQEEFDELVAEVQQSFEDLVLKKDTYNYNAYQRLVLKFNKLDENSYTHISYRLLEIKIKEAQLEFEKETTTQEIIDKKVSEINELFKGLEVKDD